MSNYQAVINWYPGHMARACRLLNEQIRNADLLIEVCDARLPLASRNPDLIRMAERKEHLLLLNKSDLADARMNQEWIAYFRSQGINAHLLSIPSGSMKDVYRLIETATKAKIERSLEKGVRKVIRAMVIGIPNVGKSTLINRLCGRAVTEIGDRPGVTKSNRWVKVSDYFEVLDTPGLLWPRLQDQCSARRLCYIGSIKDDVVDLADLTIHLMEELCELIPQKVSERFRITDPSARGVALLDGVCAGRGFLLKGAQYDYDRCCSIVLDEFRAGKLGRITLEKPPKIDNRENDRND